MYDFKTFSYSNRKVEGQFCTVYCDLKKSVPYTLALLHAFLFTFQFLKFTFMGFNLPTFFAHPLGVNAATMLNNDSVLDIIIFIIEDIWI